MARGRIFSSRRMFSTRRDTFAASSRDSGPLGVVLGLTAAGIIIFAVGIYVGAQFPSTFGFGASVPVPVAATPPEAEAPTVTFAPEPPSEPVSGEQADEAVPDTAPAAPLAPETTTPDAPSAVAPAQTPPASTPATTTP